MRLLAIQFIIVALAAFAVGGAFRRYLRRELSLRRLLGWTVVWGGATVVVLVPTTSERLAAILGVGRGADVIIYLSVAALFYLQFRLFARVDRLERDITTLTRHAALKDFERKS